MRTFQLIFEGWLVHRSDIPFATIELILVGDKKESSLSFDGP